MLRSYLLHIFLIYLSQTCTDAVYQGKNLFLIDAVQENNVDVVKWLIKDEAFVDIQNSAGETPLMRAAAKIDGLDIVKILLDAGASVELKNNQGLTAIHEATQSGSLETLKLLYNNVTKETLRNVVEGSPLLHIAAERGDNGIINLLTDEGESPLVQDKNGLTAIHLAAMAGQVHLLSLWSDQIINLNVSKETPLMLAVLSGQEKSVINLIEAGVDVDCRDVNSSTPLHAAAFLGNLELIQLLVDNNATMDLKDSLNRTPLYIALEQGHLLCAKYLIESNSSLNITDKFGNTMLHAAAASSNIQILDLLNITKDMVDIKNEKGTTALIVAAKKGNNEVIERLIDLGADINIFDQNNDSLVLIAASTGNLNILNEIKKKQKSLKYDIKGSSNATPLHYAARFGDRELVNFIIDAAAEEYYLKQNNSGLRFTRSTKLKLLLCPFCYRDITNIKDEHGRTAIYYAAENGNAEAISSLVMYGGNISIPDQNGRLPLHAAVSQGRDNNVINLLVLLSGNVNTKDNTGKTPLFLSAEAGHVDTFKHLIDIGADINTTDEIGWTVLHTAVVNGRLNIVSKLLENKELLNKPDKKEITPAWYALTNNQSIILSMLHKAGAIIKPSMDIFEAVKEGKWSAAKYMFNDCEGLASSNRNGETLMHIAAAEGHKPIIKELSKHQCLINKIDFNGLTPAMHAITNKHWDSFELLQSLNSINSDEYLFPLMKSKDLEGIKYLIEHGSDVNVQDDEGHSLLWNAVNIGFSDAVESLIESGVRYTATEGTSLLQLALDEGKCDTAKVLIDHRAGVRDLPRRYFDYYRPCRDIIDRYRWVI